MFKSNIINAYGESGKLWLDKLPELVVSISSNFGLKDLKEADNLSYNYILSGLHKNKAVILKLGIDTKELSKEALALKCFSKHGAIKVLAEDKGMLLLEKAVPGISLKSYYPIKEKNSIQITFHIMQELHKANIPKNHNFPHLREWLKLLDQEYSIPNQYLQKARIIRNTLLDNAHKEVLLHGDLHHDNILKHGNNWVVIDPKGVIGEATFEVTAFIRNPIPKLLAYPNPEYIISNRIKEFSNLMDLPLDRIYSWCYVQNIISWIWNLEDKQDTEYNYSLAKILHELDKSMGIKIEY